MRKKDATLEQPAPAKGMTGEKTAVVVRGGGPSPKVEPISEEQIRIRAFQKWETAGKPIGEDLKFWLEAEEELRHPRWPAP